MPYITLSDAYAPEEWITRISPIPLLVVHGDADDVIEFELGQRVFELASQPKQFWKIDGGRHIDFLHRKEWAARLLDYVEEVLEQSR